MKLDFATYQQVLQPDLLQQVLQDGTGRRYIWQITQPKSGSHLVDHFFANFFEPGAPFFEEGRMQSYLVPAWGTRGHEIDTRLLLLLGDKDSYIHYHPTHTSYSDYTESVIRTSRMKVVLQLRNFVESLNSMFRYYVSIGRSEIYDEGLMQNNLAGLSDEEILHYCFTVGAPSQIQFLSGWLNSPLIDDPNLFLIDFSDLIKNRSDVFVRLADFADFDITADQIEVVINSGVGDDTNESRIPNSAEIRQMCSRYYPDMLTLQRYFPIPERFSHFYDLPEV